MTNNEAWNYAIGLIKVDGLGPTKDLKIISKKKKRRNNNARLEVVS